MGEEEEEVEEKRSSTVLEGKDTEQEQQIRHGEGIKGQAEGKNEKL